MISAQASSGGLKPHPDQWVMGKSPLAPELAPDESEHITERGGTLAIPGRLSDRKRPIWVQRLSNERHQTGEAKEERSRALDGTIRPVALRFDASMGASFLKGHFQTPALHEVLADLFCWLGGIGAQDGLWGTLARWITSQHPPNGQGSVSRAIPQGSARPYLQSSLAFPLPVQRQ